MTVRIAQYSCICGAQTEGEPTPPKCWSCGRQMKQWATREAEFAPRIIGEAA